MVSVIKKQFFTILSVHSPFKCLSLQKIEGECTDCVSP